MTNERDLILEYNSGNHGVVEEIWKLNEELVTKICEKSFIRSGCPREDLIQEGFLGLLEAVRRFKPEQADKFYSYKCIWIKKRMFDFRKWFYKGEPTRHYGPFEAEWQEPSSEKFRKAILELDNLVKAGKVPELKAKKLLKSIIKGTR